MLRTPYLVEDLARACTLAGAQPCGATVDARCGLLCQGSGEALRGATLVWPAGSCCRALLRTADCRCWCGVSLRWHCVSLRWRFMRMVLCLTLAHGIVLLIAHHCVDVNSDMPLSPLSAAACTCAGADSRPILYFSSLVRGPCCAALRRDCTACCRRGECGPRAPAAPAP